MSYVDGYVVPVPKANKEAYRALAQKMTATFKKHGALHVVEAWGDDVPRGKVTDFYGAVKATDDEAVVFSWIVWPSKAVRDAANEAMKADPSMQPSGDEPFDGKRMIFGGFQTIVDER